MATSWIKAHLERMLAPVIDKFDSNLLSIDGLGGFSVNNLSLNCCIFDALDLPITITNVFVSKFRLAVDWARLFSAPIKVSVGGLYISCSSPTEAMAHDRLRSLLACTNAQIAGAESAAKLARDRVSGTPAKGHDYDLSHDRSASDVPPLPSSGYGRLLVRAIFRITRALQLDVQRVLVEVSTAADARDGTNTSSTSTLGIMLQRIGVDNPPVQGEAEGPSGLPPLAYKHLPLTGLGVYTRMGVGNEDGEVENLATVFKECKEGPAACLAERLGCLYECCTQHARDPALAHVHSHAHVHVDGSANGSAQASGQSTAENAAEQEDGADQMQAARIARRSFTGQRMRSHPDSLPARAEPQVSTPLGQQLQEPLHTLRSPCQWLLLPVNASATVRARDTGIYTCYELAALLRKSLPPCWEESVLQAAPTTPRPLRASTGTRQDRAMVAEWERFMEDPMSVVAEQWLAYVQAQGRLGGLEAGAGPLQQWAMRLGVAHPPVVHALQLAEEACANARPAMLDISCTIASVRVRATDRGVQDVARALHMLGVRDRVRWSQSAHLDVDSIMQEAGLEGGGGPQASCVVYKRLWGDRARAQCDRSGAGERALALQYVLESYWLSRGEGLLLAQLRAEGAAEASSKGLLGGLMGGRWARRGTDGAGPASVLTELRRAAGMEGGLEEAHAASPSPVHMEGGVTIVGGRAWRRAPLATVHCHLEQLTLSIIRPGGEGEADGEGVPLSPLAPPATTQSTVEGQGEGGVLPLLEDNVLASLEVRCCTLDADVSCPEVVAVDTKGVRAATRARLSSARAQGQGVGQATHEGVHGGGVQGDATSLPLSALDDEQPPYGLSAHLRVHDVWIVETATQSGHGHLLLQRVPGLEESGCCYLTSAPPPDLFDAHLTMCHSQHGTDGLPNAPVSLRLDLGKVGLNVSSAVFPPGAAVLQPLITQLQAKGAPDTLGDRARAQGRAADASIVPGGGRAPPFSFPLYPLHTGGNGPCVSLQGRVALPLLRLALNPCEASPALVLDCGSLDCGTSLVCPPTGLHAHPCCTRVRMSLTGLEAHLEGVGVGVGVGEGEGSHILRPMAVDIAVDMRPRVSAPPDATDTTPSMCLHVSISQVSVQVSTRAIRGMQAILQAVKAQGGWEGQGGERASAPTGVPPPILPPSLGYPDVAWIHTQAVAALLPPYPSTANTGTMGIQLSAMVTVADIHVVLAASYEDIPPAGMPLPKSTPPWRGVTLWGEGGCSRPILACALSGLSAKAGIDKGGRLTAQVQLDCLAVHDALRAILTGNLGTGRMGLTSTRMQLHPDAFCTLLAIRALDMSEIPVPVEVLPTHPSPCLLVSASYPGTWEVGASTCPCHLDARVGHVAVCVNRDSLREAGRALGVDYREDKDLDRAVVVLRARTTPFGKVDIQEGSGSGGVALERTGDDAVSSLPLQPSPPATSLLAAALVEVSGFTLVLNSECVFLPPPHELAGGGTRRGGHEVMVLEGAAVRSSDAADIDALGPALLGQLGGTHTPRPTGEGEGEAATFMRSLDFGYGRAGSDSPYVFLGPLCALHLGPMSLAAQVWGGCTALSLHVSSLHAQALQEAPRGAEGDGGGQDMPSCSFAAGEGRGGGMGLDLARETSRMSLASCTLYPSPVGLQPECPVSAPCIEPLVEPGLTASEKGHAQRYARSALALGMSFSSSLPCGAEFTLAVRPIASRVWPPGLLDIVECVTDIFLQGQEAGADADAQRQPDAAPAPPLTDPFRSEGPGSGWPLLHVSVGDIEVVMTGHPIGSGKEGEMALALGGLCAATCAPQAAAQLSTLPIPLPVQPQEGILDMCAHYAGWRGVGARPPAILRDEVPPRESVSCLKAQVLPCRLSLRTTRSPVRGPALTREPVFELDGCLLQLQQGPPLTAALVLLPCAVAPTPSHMCTLQSMLAPARPTPAPRAYLDARVCVDPLPPWPRARMRMQHAHAGRDTVRTVTEAGDGLPPVDDRQASACFALASIDMKHIGVILLLGDTACAPGGLTTTSRAAQARGRLTGIESTRGGEGGLPRYPSSTLRPLLALGIEGMRCTASMTRSGDAGACLWLSSLSMVDARRKRDTPIRVHPLYRTLVHLSSTGVVQRQDGGEVDPELAPPLIRVEYTGTSNGLSTGRVQALHPADFVDSVARAKERPSAVRPTLPVYGTVKAELDIQDLQLVLSPALVAAASWVEVPVSSYPTPPSVQVYEECVRHGLTVQAHDEAAKAHARTAGPALALPVDPRFCAPLIPPPLPSCLAVAFSVRVQRPALYLMRDPADPYSDGLAGTLSLHAQGNADSEGYIACDVEIISARGMRIVPDEATRRLHHEEVRAGQSSGRREAEWGVGMRHGSGEIPSTSSAPSSSSGALSDSESDAEAAPGTPAARMPRTRTRSPGMLAALPLHGRPRHLTLPGVRDSDFLRPFSMGVHLSALPARTIPGTPVSLSLPSFFTARVSTVDDLIGRVGFRDLLLVLSALGSGARDKSREQGADARPALAEGGDSSGTGCKGQDSVQTAPLPTDNRTVHAGPEGVGGGTTDPTHLSFSASLMLPTFVLILVNDLGELDMPLVVLSLADTRASALGYHVADRILAAAGTSINVDFFNVSKALFEPMVEHWSVKAFLLNAEPVRATACTGLPPGADHHVHVALGVGGSSDVDRGSDPRLVHGSHLYALEDSLAGMVSLNVPTDIDPTLPGCVLVDSAMEGGQERPAIDPSRTARLVQRVQRLFGGDLPGRAAEHAMSLQASLALERPPYVSETGQPAGLDKEFLPADCLVRLVAKKPLQLNVSGAMMNSLLDSYSILLGAMAEGAGAGQVGNSGSGCVYVHNSCEKAVYWMDSASVGGREKGELGEGGGGRQQVTQQRSLFFPLRTRLVRSILVDTPIPAIRMLEPPSVWEGVVLAGACACYVARKDAWFRWYTALTVEGELLLWDSAPRPQEGGAWLLRTCARIVALKAQGLVVGDGSTLERLRPPSAYVLQACKPVAVHLAAALPVDLDLAMPVLTLALSSAAEQLAWCEALRAVGVRMQECHAQSAPAPSATRATPPPVHVSLRMAADNVQRMAAVTSAMREAPGRNGSVSGLPVEGETGACGCRLAPDGFARTHAPVASEEGCAASDVLARARFAGVAGRHKVGQAARLPLVWISFQPDVGCPPGAPPPHTGRRTSWEVRTDRVATHFLPWANPFAVPQASDLLGSAMAMQPGSKTGPEPERAELSSAAHVLGQGAVADVTFEGGRKSVVVRSTVAVQNMTGCPALAQYEDVHGVVVARRRLGPGQVGYAPLGASAGGCVRFAPMLPGYERMQWGMEGGGRVYAEDLANEATRGTHSGTPPPPATPSSSHSRSQAEEEARQTEPVPCAEYGGGENVAVPLPTTVPLSMITPYALSPPVSLVDDSCDQIFHSAQRSLLRTIIAGPESVPTTTLGAALPISCSPAHAQAGSVHARLPTFYAAVHVVRPARSLFRRAPGGLDLGAALAGLVGGGMLGGNQGTSLIDGVDLTPDPATGVLTEEREEVDFAVARRVQDKFTSLCTLLPALVIENMLPYPARFRVFPGVATAPVDYQDGGGQTDFASGTSALMDCRLLPGEQKQLLFARASAACVRPEEEGCNAHALPPLACSVYVDTPHYRPLGWSQVKQARSLKQLRERGAGTTAPTRFPGILYGFDCDGEAEVGDHTVVHLAEPDWGKKTGAVRVAPLHLRLHRLFAGVACGAVDSAEAEDSLLSKFASNGSKDRPDPDVLAMADARRRAVSLHVRLVAPYWLINRSDLPLAVAGFRSRCMWAGSQGSAMARRRMNQVAALPPGAEGAEVGAPSLVSALDVRSGTGPLLPEEQEEEEQGGEGGDFALPKVHIELLGDLPEERKDGGAPRAVLSNDLSSARWSNGVSLTQVGTAQTACIVEGGGVPLHLEPFLSRAAAEDADRKLYKHLARKAQAKVRAELCVGAHVEIAAGHFSCSRIVTFAPRLVMVNRTGLDVAWRQVEGEGIKEPLMPIFDLPFPGSQANGSGALPQLRNETSGSTPEMSWMPVHWANSGGPKAVQIRLIGRHDSPSASLADLALLSPTQSTVGTSARAQGGDGGLNVWQWSAPVQPEDGERSFKLRRILAGPHLPSKAVVGLPETELATSSCSLSGQGGVSPDQSTWLHVSVISTGGTTFLSLQPNPAMMKPHLRSVAYRIDNYTSMCRLQIRQRGRGPAAVEQVPAYGGSNVSPRLYALDDPAREHSLLMSARPVGVADLCYWDGGRIGRLLKKHDFRGAAGALIENALLGPDAPVGLRDRHNDSWATWGGRDGAGAVSIDEVGSKWTLRVGRHGGGGAVKRFAVTVHVYADATTGPTKVIHVTDAPVGSGDSSTARSAGPTVDFLLQCVKESRRFETLGKALLAEVMRSRGRREAALSAAAATAEDLHAEAEEDHGGGGGGAVSPVGSPALMEGHSRRRSSWPSGVVQAAIGATRFLRGPHATAGPLQQEPVLWVQVTSAMSMPIADVSGSSDPFAQVTLELVPPPAPSSVEAVSVPGVACVPARPSRAHTPPPHTVQKLGSFNTGVCRASLDPVWNHEHTFSIPAHVAAAVRSDSNGASSLRLHLTVLDYDLHSASDVLGEAIVPITLSSAPKGREEVQDAWFCLSYTSGCDKRPTGSVRVRHVYSNDLDGVRLSLAETQVRDALADTQAVKTRLLAQMEEIVTRLGPTKGGITHEAAESSGAGPGAAHLHVAQTNAPEVSGRNPDRDAIASSTMLADEAGEERAVPRPVRSTRTMRGGMSPPVPVSLTRDPAAVIQVESRQGRRGEVKARDSASTCPDRAALECTRARVIGHQLEVTLVEAENVSPLLLHAMRVREDSMARERNRLEAEAGEKLTRHKTKTVATATPATQSEDACACACASTSRVYAVIRGGPVTRRTAPAPCTMRLRFLHRPLGLVFVRSTHADAVEGALDRRASLLRPVSEGGSIDDVSSRTMGEGEGGRSTSLFAATGDGRGGAPPPLRLFLREGDPRACSLKLCSIDTAVAQSAVDPRDAEILLCVHTQPSLHLLSVNGASLSCMSFTEARAALHAALAVKGPVEVVLGVDLGTDSDRAGQAGSSAAACQVSCGWSQMVDFGDRVPPPRPGPSVMSSNGSPPVTTSPPIQYCVTEGSPRGPGGGEVGAPSNHALVMAPAAPTSGPGRSRPGYLPSYLSLSLFARTADDADEFPVAGGDMVGQPSHVPPGPWGLMREAGIGEEDWQEDVSAGVMSKAATAVKVAVGGAASLGKGIGSAAMSGTKAMGHVLLTAARAEEGEEDEDDPATLIRHTPDAASVTLDYFLPHPHPPGATANARGDLPSGAMSRGDTLLAHLDWLPVPPQGVIADKWIALDPMLGEDTSGTRGGPHPHPVPHTPGTQVNAEPDVSVLPRVRVKVQWVPLYACKAAVRRFRVQAHLKGINLSIVDFEPKELLCLAASRLHADFSLFHAGRTVLSAGVASLSVSNMVPGALNPLVLGPATSLVSDQIGCKEGEGRNSKTASALARMQPDDVTLRLVLQAHPVVLYVESAAVRLLHQSVRVDDSLACELLALVARLHLGALCGAGQGRGVRGILQGSDDVEGRRAARAARPQGQVLVDMFEGWTAESWARPVLSPSRHERADQPGGSAGSPGALTGRDTPLALSLARALHAVGHIRCTEPRRAMFAAPGLQTTHVPDPHTLEGSLKLYFGLLRLSPLSLDVTFTLSDPGLLARLLPNVGLLAYAKVGLESAGTALANIEHAPIALDPLLASHIFESPEALVRRLITHYVQDALREWYKVLGSASFLGNPLGLVAGVQRDALVLLLNPASGLLDDPTQAVAVLGSSAMNLARNTAVSVMDSAAQVASSASKAVKAIHYDDKRDRTKSRFYQPPVSLLDGLQQGTGTFGLSVASSALGLLVDPVRGGAKGGLIGAVKGVGSGVIGVLTKPLAGVLDGIVFALQGAAAGVSNRVCGAGSGRLPRFLGSDGRLLPVSLREGEGAARLWLLQVKDPRARAEQYVYHTPAWGMVPLRANDVFPKEWLSQAAADGVILGEPGQGQHCLTAALPLRRDGKHAAAIASLCALWSARRAQSAGEVPPSNARSSLTTGQGTAEGEGVDRVPHIHVETGKKLVLGIPIRAFPLSRKPAVLRTADRIAGRGPTERAPYCVLITSMSAYVLDGRTNGVLWRASLNQAGLLAMEKAGVARKVLRGAAASASATAGGAFAVAGTAARAAGTVVSAAGAVAVSIGRPFNRGNSTVHTKRQEGTDGLRDSSTVPVVLEEQADTRPTDLAASSRDNFLRLVTAASVGPALSLASHDLTRAARVMLCENAQVAQLCVHAVDSAVAGRDARMPLLNGETELSRLCSTASHDAAEHGAASRLAARLAAVAVEARGRTLPLRLHHIALHVDDLSHPARGLSLQVQGVSGGHDTVLARQEAGAGQRTGEGSGGHRMLPTVHRSMEGIRALYERVPSLWQGPGRACFPDLQALRDKMDAEGPEGVQQELQEALDGLHRALQVETMLQLASDPRAIDPADFEALNFFFLNCAGGGVH